MLAFKRTPNSIFNFLTLVIATLLIGCWGPGKQGSDFVNKLGMTDDPNSSADFLVTNLTGQSTSTKEYDGEKEFDGEWETTRYKTYQFEACLIDKNTKTQMRNQKFRVFDGTKYYETSTGNNSCIKWTEKNIRFNYYAKSAYLQFDRVIEPSKDGLNKGSYTVRILVNPWAPYRKVLQPIQEVYHWEYNKPSPVNEELIVTGAQEVSAALSGSSMVSKDYAQLFIEDPSLKVTKKSEILHNAHGSIEERNINGYVLDVDMKIKPFVKVKNINGETATLSIPAGRFKVYHEIVATELGDGADKSLALENDRNEILTAKVPPTTGFIRADKYLRVNTSATFTKRVSSGRLMLALKIVPQEAPWFINPYEGLYLMGNHSKLVTNATLSLEKDKHFDNFSFLKFIKETSDFELLKKTYAAHDNQPFDFSIAQGVYETVAPGETATQRTVQFRTKTCLSDNALAGERVQRRQFVIFRDGKRLSENDSRTDEEGCLNPMGEVSHAYYKPERLIPVVYKIYNSARDAESQIIQGKHLFDLVIKVNPWDAKFTFFRDSRVVSEELEASLKRQKIESRFFMSGFQYQTLRFSYDIDKFLNLTVNKMVLFQIEPQVLRYNSIEAGRNSVERLRDGIYLLKIAFQKDYLDPATRGLWIKRNDKKNANNRDLFVAQLKNPNTGVFEDLAEDKLNRHKKQYISIVKKLVRVNAGRVITPIELDIRDLRLMRIRSQFLIELQPIDERLLQVANRFDQNFSTELHQRWVDRYESIINEYAAKHGGEQAQKLENYLKQVGKQISDIDLFRALADKDELDKLKYEVSKKQNDLQSLVQSLQDDQEGKQQRAIDNPEAFKKILEGFDLYDDSFKNELAKNDFTVIPAAPLFQDLDILVEKPEVSGLKARTFIGPMTFLLNSNHSAVRPTDTLDSTWCALEDCNSVSFNDKPSWGLTANGIYFKPLNGEYRNEKYYQSVSHLENVQVDDLIEEFYDLKRDHAIEMRQRSNVGNFINLFGYKFVSLKDEDLVTFNEKKKEDRACDSIHNDGFEQNCMHVNNENRLTYGEFLSKYNETSHAEGGIRSLVKMGWDNFVETGGFSKNSITKERLKELIYTGEMNTFEAHKFCAMFIEQLFKGPDAIPFENDRELQRSYKLIKETCMETANDKNSPEPFIIERRLRVKELGENFIFNGGKQMNVNVGSNVSLVRDERFSYGIGINGTAFGKAFGAMVSGLTSVFKVGADYFQGKSSNESTVINEQTFLVMQAATFDIEIKKYEQCAAVKWNPDVFVPTFFKFFNGYLDFHKIARNQGKDIFMPGGFFFCTGVNEEKPIFVRENYYYFTQHFTDGDMLDSGDLYNHPWLLAIRGVRDVSAFVSNLTKNDFEILQTKESPRGGDRWPIKKMVDVYLKTLPTFPGMYTILPDYGPDYPRNYSPQQSFAELAPASLDSEDFSEKLLGMGGFDDMVNSRNLNESEYKNWEKENKISSEAAQILLKWLKFVDRAEQEESLKQAN